MKKLFLGLSLCLASLPAAQAFECAETAQLKFGEIQLVDFVTGTGYKTETTRKRKYIRDRLSDQTKSFSLKSISRVGQSTLCSYTIPNSDLQLEIKATPKFIVMTMSKDYSLVSYDQDLEIYDNQLLLEIRMERASHELERRIEVQDAKILSRFNYYYSCGFADCTDSMDERVNLAYVSSMSAKF